MFSHLSIQPIHESQWMWVKLRIYSFDVDWLLLSLHGVKSLAPIACAVVAYYVVRQLQRITSAVLYKNTEIAMCVCTLGLRRAHQIALIFH